VVVRNRVSNQGSQCIRYHAVFGKFPDLSDLRVNGWQVFSHIDKRKHRKLVHKSLEGITNMPLIAMLGSFTTQILGVSLELTMLYSMSNGNQTHKVNRIKIIVARWRCNSLNLTWYTLVFSVMDIRLKF